MSLRISDDVAIRILDDEAVILNLAAGVYFGLDRVGTRMWQLLSEQGATEAVIEAMLDEYDVEEAQLRSDLDNLIRQLIENGLLTADAESDPTAE